MVTHPLSRVHLSIQLYILHIRRTCTCMYAHAHTRPVRPGDLQYGEVSMCSIIQYNVRTYTYIDVRHCIYVPHEACIHFSLIHMYTHTYTHAVL